MSQHNAYLIRWVDSCSYSGWQGADADHAVSEITSIGWEVKRTERSISISTSIGSTGNAMDVLTIPRSCIIEKKKLNYRIKRR